MKRNRKEYNRLKAGVYRRDNWQCALCGDNAGLQAHHIIPRSRGGVDTAANLVSLCWRCHALAHGVRPYGCPAMSAQDVEDAVVEYIAELYACEGIIWDTDMCF